MVQADKVGRVYAGGDNLWKFYGYNFDKSMMLDAFKTVDEVGSFMKHIGAPFSKTNIVTGAKLNLDDALDDYLRGIGDSPESRGTLSYMAIFNDAYDIWKASRGIGGKKAESLLDITKKLK